MYFQDYLDVKGPGCDESSKPRQREDKEGWWWTARERYSAPLDVIGNQPQMYGAVCSCGAQAAFEI